MLPPHCECHSSAHPSPQGIGTSSGRRPLEIGNCESPKRQRGTRPYPSLALRAFNDTSRGNQLTLRLDSEYLSDEAQLRPCQWMEMRVYQQTRIHADAEKRPIAPNARGARVPPGWSGAWDRCPPAHASCWKGMTFNSSQLASRRDKRSSKGTEMYKLEWQTGMSAPRKELGTIADELRNSG